MQRYPLAAFVAITFLISWGAWLAGASKQAFLIGAFAPGIAAVIVVALGGRGSTRATSAGVEPPPSAVLLRRTGGPPGVMAALQQLFERLLIWRVHIICYLAALLLPALVSLFATTVHMMFGGDAPDFAAPPITGIKLPGYLQGWHPAALFLPLFIQHILYGTAIAEELGWRGVVLPRLQRSALGSAPASGAPARAPRAENKTNSFVASLILGCLWALWILPFYWKQGWIGGNERAFLLLAVIPGAILSTWIYNISGGSLLLCVIFNIALKVTDLVLAAPQSHPLVGVCAYWMAAGLILSFTGVHLGAPKPVPAAADGDRPRSEEQLLPTDSGRSKR